MDWRQSFFLVFTLDNFFSHFREVPKDFAKRQKNLGKTVLPSNIFWVVRLWQYSQLGLKNSQTNRIKTQNLFLKSYECFESKFIKKFKDYYILGKRCCKNNKSFINFDSLLANKKNL